MGRCPRLQLKSISVSVLWHSMLGIRSYCLMGTLDISVIGILRFCHVGCNVHQISQPTRLRIETIANRGVRSGWTPSTSLRMLNVMRFYHGVRCTFRCGYSSQKNLSNRVGGAVVPLVDFDWKDIWWQNSKLCSVLGFRWFDQWLSEAKLFAGTSGMLVKQRCLCALTQQDLNA